MENLRGPQRNTEVVVQNRDRRGAAIAQCADGQIPLQWKVDQQAGG